MHLKFIYMIYKKYLFTTAYISERSWNEDGLKPSSTCYKCRVKIPCWCQLAHPSLSKVTVRMSICKPRLVLSLYFDHNILPTEMELFLMYIVWVEEWKIITWFRGRWSFNAITTQSASRCSLHKGFWWCSLWKIPHLS